MSFCSPFQIAQFLLIQNVLLAHIIELPFTKKELPPDQSESQVVKYLEKNTLIIELSIGTPYQKMRMVPKTERVFSYVLEDKELSPNKPLDLIEYKSADSQSYSNPQKIKTFSWIYGNSNYITENAKVNQIEIKNLTLIQALNYDSIQSITTESGILGLGLFNQYDDYLFKTNFIKNLKENRIISSYNFFISYDNDRQGKIVIGAEPNEYNQKEFINKINTFVRLPSSENVYWGFDIDKMTYNDVDVRTLLVRNARIKLEYGYIGVGEKIKQIVDSQLFERLLLNGICHQVKLISSTVYVCQKGKVDKSKLSVLKIYNKDFDYTFNIDFKDLFFDYGEQTYFLVEFILEGGIYLGEPFIKKNLFLFNQDSKTLGMFREQPILPNEKTEGISKGLIFLFILIVVLALSIISVLFYFLYKFRLFKPKRKIGIELADDTYMKFSDLNSNVRIDSILK